MPAWFDLFSLDPTGQEDDRGIEKSKQIITNLIEQEINNGIDPSRIILGKQTFRNVLASKLVKSTDFIFLLQYFRWIFSRGSFGFVYWIDWKI